MQMFNTDGTKKRGKARERKKKRRRKCQVKGEYLGKLGWMINSKKDSEVRKDKGGAIRTPA